MALPAAGNSISLKQTNVELGLTATAAINMGGSAVRGLFDVSSGAIDMSDGFGKSSETLISSNVQQMTVSDHISAGGTLRIDSGVYIWSDSTGTAGMIIDIACTIINEGYIIGKGGLGANGLSSDNVANGSAGGAAISVTSSGVTITNASGAYIAGGGGGGAAASYYAQWEQGDDNYNAWRPSGAGGGGAGGGAGNNGGQVNDSAGGSVGATGANGSANGSTIAYGGGAGGGGGIGIGDRTAYTMSGAGGGRILPGAGGGTNGYTGGEGGAAGAAGTNDLASGESVSGGGGGGWGAAGGNAIQGAIQGSTKKTGTGGAGGGAVTGTARTLNNSGTVYGST